MTQGATMHPTPALQHPYSSASKDVSPYPGTYGRSHAAQNLSAKVPSHIRRHSSQNHSTYPMKLHRARSSSLQHHQQYQQQQQSTSGSHRRATSTQSPPFKPRPSRQSPECEQPNLSKPLPPPPPIAAAIPPTIPESRPPSFLAPIPTENKPLAPAPLFSKPKHTFITAALPSPRRTPASPPPLPEFTISRSSKLERLSGRRSYDFVPQAAANLPTYTLSQEADHLWTVHRSATSATGSAPVAEIRIGNIGHHARLSYTASTAKVEISRQNGGAGGYSYPVDIEALGQTCSWEQEDPAGVSEFNWVLRDACLGTVVSRADGGETGGVKVLIDVSGEALEEILISGMAVCEMQRDREDVGVDTVKSADSMVTRLGRFSVSAGASRAKGMIGRAVDLK